MNPNKIRINGLQVEEVMLGFAALTPTYMLRQHDLNLRDAGAAIRAGLEALTHLSKPLFYFWFAHTS
jgi:hypothetical protein